MRVTLPLSARGGIACALRYNEALHQRARGGILTRASRLAARRKLADRPLSDRPLVNFGVIPPRPKNTIWGRGF